MGKINQTNKPAVNRYASFCLTYGGRSANASRVNLAEFSHLLPHRHGDCVAVGLSGSPPFLWRKAVLIICAFVTAQVGCCDTLEQELCLKAVGEPVLERSILPSVAEDALLRACGTCVQRWLLMHGYTLLPRQWQRVAFQMLRSSAFLSQREVRMARLLKD